MKVYKLLFVALIPGLTACGTLDSIFPDRKKEYKETSTIPPLEIPPDLSSSSIEAALPLPNERSFLKNQPSGQTGGSEATVASAPEAQVAYSTLVQGEGGASYLRLNDQFPSAWRTAGKALANLTIEIEDRNRALGIYYIRYAENLEVEDKGLWGSIAFWRDEEVAEEKPYQVKLKQEGSSTTLKVSDEHGQPLSQSNGMPLLRAFHAEFNSF